MSGIWVKKDGYWHTVAYQPENINLRPIDSAPHGVCFDGRYLRLIGTQTDKMITLSLNNHHLSEYDWDLHEDMSRASGVAFDGTNFYVGDSDSSGTIYVHTYSGEYLRNFTTGSSIGDLTWNGTHIVKADFVNAGTTSVRFFTTAGAIQGISSSNRNNFSVPSGRTQCLSIAYLPDSDNYLMGYGSTHETDIFGWHSNSRTWASGSIIGLYPAQIAGSLEIYRPHGMTWDGDNVRILYGDFPNGMVVRSFETVTSGREINDPVDYVNRLSLKRNDAWVNPTVHAKHEGTWHSFS